MWGLLMNALLVNLIVENERFLLYRLTTPISLPSDKFGDHQPIYAISMLEVDKK